LTWNIEPGNIIPSGDFK